MTMRRAKFLLEYKFEGQFVRYKEEDRVFCPSVLCSKAVACTSMKGGWTNGGE